VLLGAGASAEAGIPTTVELTERILAAFGERHGEHSRALNFICGQIIGFDSARGVSPYVSLDVERVFSAIELLAERATLEVAPFVSTWHPGVDAFDTVPGNGLSTSWAREFHESIAGSRFGGPSASALQRKFEEGVRELTGSTSRGVYRSLLTAVTQRLRELLAIPETSVLSYLAPLIDCGAATVATLNYDQSIELLCRDLSVPVHVGIADWTSRGELSWGEGGIRLLKLHGSIDWSFGNDNGGRGRIADRPIEVNEELAKRGLPAVVFGQRGKLTAEGPFLELLAEFDRSLREADELLVVGYSFRDAHVNEYIKRWANADATRTIVVVDPQFPKSQWPRDFRVELQLALMPRDNPNLPLPTRMTVIREPASVGIPLALALAVGSDGDR